MGLNKNEWHILAERMKMREKHIVPLSKQALEVLEKMKPISGHRELILPEPRNPTGSFTIESPSFNVSYIVLRTSSFTIADL